MAVLARTEVLRVVVYGTWVLVLAAAAEVLKDPATEVEPVVLEAVLISVETVTVLQVAVIFMAAVAAAHEALRQAAVMAAMVPVVPCVFLSKRCI